MNQDNQTTTAVSLPDVKEKKRGVKKPAAKAKSKAKNPAAAKKPAAAKSKTAVVVAMLTRKSGCTRAEVLGATGWTAISMLWLPSYIERLALAPLESVAETMRARVGVRSSLRRSFKDKLGWKPAIILSRKDWHCVQNRAVVSRPRPGTEVRLDPAPPAWSPLRGFGGDGGNRRLQPNGGSHEIDRHPIVAPVSGFTARRPCP